MFCCVLFLFSIDLLVRYAASKFFIQFIGLCFRTLFDFSRLVSISHSAKSDFKIAVAQQSNSK